MRKIGKKKILTAAIVLLALVLSCVYFVDKGRKNNPANKTVLSAAVPEDTASPESTPSPTPGETQSTAEDGAAPESSPAVTMTISNYAVLRPGDDYPEVQNLQMRLMELGYLESDEPGSEYNYAVETAVETFQRALGIEPTGTADSETQEKLFEADAVRYEVKIGSDGTDIRSMQKMLNELGYYNGKITGYFGAETEKALVSFQSKNGLETDGKYNNEDRELLYSNNAQPLVTVTPTPEPTDTPKPESTSKPKATKKPSDPSATSAPKATATPKPSSSDSDSGKVYPTGGTFHATGNVSGVISVAEAQIGKQYVLGDEGPDTFDCSGLVYYCLKMNGVGVGRRSAASYASNDSWKLISSMNDVQKGDLLFFTDPKHVGKVTHVGIYIGGGKMIDASSSRGEVVRRSSTSEYWETNFVCARRVF